MNGVRKNWLALAMINMTSLFFKFANNILNKKKTKRSGKLNINKIEKDFRGVSVERTVTIYEKYIKRIMDIVCALLALGIFWWLYIVVALMVRMKLGVPVVFKQIRPGKNEKLFMLYKFRTMTNEKDEDGNLLPDEVRLTAFGRALRRTSLDELPEVINILKGEMSVIGPRPQLVRDMVFMTDKQRKRHDVRPGLSGLAQVNGRNGIDWEEKLEWDLKYIQKITFWGDLKIIFRTVLKAFLRQEGITDGKMATAEDYGDYLLEKGQVEMEEYMSKQIQAKKILGFKDDGISIDKINRNEHIPFSVVMSVYKNDIPEFFDRALASITEDQTVVPNEIVLVVDGPVSKEIDIVLEKYAKKYNIFNIVRLEKNAGLGNALKIAVNKAKYDLIARMDSDDVSVPSRFEEQLKFFIFNSDVDIVGGDITEFIGKERNIVGRRIVPMANLEIREYMKKRCAMNHVSVMYKKSAVLEAGSYQDCFWNEDYYLWIRMYLNGAVFANTGTVLVNVRVGKDMYQRRGGIKYFKSEKRLQNYMLQHQMIDYITYVDNIIKRLIIQVIVPNRLRGWLYMNFAREKKWNMH